MPSEDAILPPLLRQFLPVQPGSLTVLTGTLGASTTWLLLRLLYASARTKDGEAEGANPGPEGPQTTIVTSWLHDVAYFKEGGKKLGLNTQKIICIDALENGLGQEASGAASIEGTILKTLAEAPTANCLVLDAIDLLLAATDQDVQYINKMIYSLRQKCSCLIVTIHADSALLQPRNTPLEVAHAALTMSLAHQASMVMSLRELESGAARDVSGVLRVTPGGSSASEQDMRGRPEEMECLYWVGNDGNVKVFERGG